MRLVAPIRFAAAALVLAIFPPTVPGTLGADAPGRTKADREKQVAGFTDLLPQGSMASWQGRFASPSVEMRMLRLRRHRLQRLADMDMGVHWRLCNGVLSYDGRGKNIRSIQLYRNIEMYLDWKIPENGVGTVYLRSSPAIKMWDPSLEHLGAEVGSGGLHYNRTGVSKPLVKADNPVGQWNEFYIKMLDDRVTVKLNGQVVVDNVVLENHWNPGAPIAEGGHIEFEGSRSPIQLRNIFISVLP